MMSLIEFSASRVQRSVLILTVFLAVALRPVDALGEGTPQTTTKDRGPAKKGAASKPTKSVRPKRDPAGQLFRSAAMAEASRSIAIPLATNLHVAFDSHLLRTHTAWSGEGLNLFGPPYHGGKTPFLCTYDGPALWTMPPCYPWAAKTRSTMDLLELPAGSRFKGMSTKDETVTLLYELAIGDGKTVRVAETPSRLLLQNGAAILRRFEVTPSTEDLWFLAHAEVGKLVQASSPGSVVMIERTNGVLIAVVSGWSKAQWQAVEKEVSHEVLLNVEGKDGESGLERVRVPGRQARAYLHIPAHTEPITLEVATLVVPDLNEAARGRVELQKGLTTPSARAPRSSQGTLITAPEPKRFAGDRLAPTRAGGDPYYQIEHFPLPKEISLLVTGMDWLPNGDLAVCTWPGEIYIVEQPQGPVAAAKYRRFARGLNEPLGLKVMADQMYIVQKSELTRLADTDGNGEADLFETINNDWGYTGNYHAFAFGPVIDSRNNFYVFLCGQRGRWDVPYVGWCMTISPDGSQLDGFCSGLRAPNGFGVYGSDDDLFMADNQGNWVGACKLNHLQRGKFYGFPSGFPAPEADYKRPKAFEPPAVWFPRKLSPSTSGFITISDDRFGPFQGQMLIGDFQNAVVLRVFLERVNGQWQGVVWPLAKGFFSGVNRLSMGPDGKLYVGGLKNTAWAATAPKDYCLDRVSFTGKVPFEIKEVHATSNGFDLSFTQPVDKATAENPDNYDVAQYGYLYHETYGSPEIDHEGKKDSSTSIKVAKVAVSEDRLQVRLTLEGWKTGYVTAVHAFDLTSAGGEPLWHDTFYYTLNQIPSRGP